MKQVVDAALAAEGPTFCEIFTDTQQVWEPKSATKRLPDGTLVSPPLEDLAPSCAGRAGTADVYPPGAGAVNDDRT